MSEKERIFQTAQWVVLLGAIAALLAAQWKGQTVPLLALAVVALLTLLKVRLIILDFMGFRATGGFIAAGLMAWCLLLVGLAVTRPVLQLLLS